MRSAVPTVQVLAAIFLLVGCSDDSGPFPVDVGSDTTTEDTSGDAGGDTDSPDTDTSDDVTDTGVGDTDGGDVADGGDADGDGGDADSDTDDADVADAIDVDAPDTTDTGVGDTRDTTAPDTTPGDTGPAVCGNGRVEGDEECDDGNDDDTDECLSDCTSAACGDGIINRTFGSETFDSPQVEDFGGVLAFVCDDGGTCPAGSSPGSCNVIDDPTAAEHGICQSLRFEYATEVAWGGGEGVGSAQMHHAYNWECFDFACGPGLFTSYAADCTGSEMLQRITCEGIVGEECDDGAGNADARDACRTDCTNPRCGDAIVDSGEDCDDGALENRDVPDACRRDCRAPRCGDGIHDSDEGCDNGAGNADIADACRTSCALPACRDGIVDTGEECDDGNEVGDDGCSNNCRLPGCRDGVLQPFLGEECDDGNDIGNDGCSNTCLLPQCGDGVVNLDEECDDGNEVETDACRNSCVRATCGDEVVREGVEECDSGPRNADEPGAPCRTNCELPACGDGVVDHDLDEECDDGNRVANDGCSNICLLPRCGDGVVQSPELCDDGNDIDTDACRLDCTRQVCGDGFLADSEDCDAGEANSDEPNAACRVDCSIPRCGDSIVDLGEECDDGNGFDRDECTTLCTLPVCGDGFRQRSAGEECDDGNLVPGDGCDASCIREEGFAQGHVVFIGHDYFATNADTERLVGNAALLLAGGGGEVRVLGFDQFADRSLSGEANHTDNAIRNRASALGMAVSIDRITEYNTLDVVIDDYDVLVIYEQERGGLDLNTVGTVWAPVVQDFLDGGGVVVAADMSSGVWRILNAAGILGLTGAGSTSSSANVSILIGDDVVVTDVASPYRSTNGSGYIRLSAEATADDNIDVVAVDTGGRAMVVHRYW